MSAIDPGRRTVTPPSRHLTGWRSYLRGRPASSPTAALGVVAGEPLLVVGAHPDDETFGAGATLADLVAAGVEVHLLVLTRGEAALEQMGEDAPGLAERRTTELDEACRVLGVQSHQVLDLPDAGLAVRQREIRDQIRAYAGRLRAESLLTVWWRDPHPDHEAAGLAARSVAVELGVPVAGYAVWAPHWSEPPKPGRTDQLTVIAASRAARSTRCAAEACYASQIQPLRSNLEPVLPETMLQWRTEIVIGP